MKPNDKEIDAIYDKLLKMDKEVSRTEEELISRMALIDLPDRIKRIIAEKERLRTRLRELEK
jgi:hypothetical protein